MTGDAHGEAVRGEAARLALRLKVAADLLGTAAAPRSAASPGSIPEPSPESASTVRIDAADDEVRHLLTPTVERVTRLTELAHSLAAGAHSEVSAERAAEAIADLQPFRRPR